MQFDTCDTAQPQFKTSAGVKLDHSKTQTHFCRICLTIVSDDYLHPLTVEHKSKLFAAFKQIIGPEDPYRYICTNCSNLLDIFLDFQHVAQRSHILLETGKQLSHCNEWDQPDYVQMVATCREVTSAYRKQIDTLQNQYMASRNRSFHFSEEVPETPNIKIEPICELKEESLDENKINSKDLGYVMNNSEDDIPLKSRKRSSKPTSDESYERRRGRKPKDHPDFMPQLCDFCGKRVCGESAEGHKNQHLGIKPYPCTISGCSLMFHGRHNRLRHVKRMHSESGVEVHNCHVCGKNIRGPKRALKYHLQRHEQNQRNEKNFVCQVCGKGFTLQRYLIQHSIIHSGEFPHKCSYCGSITSGECEHT
ncbi:myoneurin-like isoform X2 [Toxorhynchites rutilus septentrionalis]|uniref:myoneurin-like isoform X2 n=1 Tax=Toxorhynchites rutilus septentrionalis TaxID=329112 RepID=UPI0024792891|nr:myoneurin-like isoform X2 [Toxorhynchites rutilus septentrionalis]